MGKEINKTKPSSLKATLALTYNQGASQFSKEAKETKTYEKYKEFKEFRKIIDREAKKRNAKPYELIDYFAEHKEELLNLLKKKDSTSQKFSKIYTHAEMEKIKSQLLKPGKLTKTGRTTINENYASGEVESWRAEGVEYHIKVEDIMKLVGKNPKVYITQLKNISLLMGMTQEQQFNNSTKEARCEFKLSYYAERRGYTKKEILRGGNFFNELKRDLLTGAYTTYRIDKIIIEGKKYTRHGIPNFYILDEPENSGDNWIVKFNDPWKDWILQVLNGNAKQYFIEERKAIEDRHTTENPYLFLFYMQLIKRKRSNLLTTPIKVINLLEDMKLPEQILARPKECFKLLKECLIYFSENYRPVPELESFKLYNDYHKTKTLPLPIAISEAFKDYEYEDFKDLIKSMGLKDIREAYISFKRPHKKAGHKLNKEENELLAGVLNWFEGNITKIPYRDQESLIKNYIIKLGYDYFKGLFETEANKYNADPVDFLTRVLPGKVKDKTEADNRSYISGISGDVFNDFPDR